MRLVRGQSMSIILLCVAWYALSSTTSVINKLVLNHFPFPLSIAMCSLMSTALYAIPLQYRSSSPSMISQIPSKWYWVFVIFPLGVGKGIAVCSSYLSLWKVPVSYMHTVKATMPLFVVICARVVLHEKQSFAVYFSLMPIVGGVIIASLTEISFDAIGLLSALCSTCTYAFLNTFVKKILQDTKVNHIRLLSILAQIALILCLPVWIYHDFRMFLYSNDIVSKNSIDGITTDAINSKWPASQVIALIAMTGFMSFLTNLVTFTLISKLTALSYAVSNCMKRLTVICISLVTLRNPVTSANIGGMLLAILGVFLYNRAKDQQRSKDRPLPLHVSDTYTSLDPQIMMKNGGMHHAKQKDYELANRRGPGGDGFLGKVLRLPGVMKSESWNVPYHYAAVNDII